VARLRPPDMNVFTASSQIEVDHHRKPVDIWCVMGNIIGQVIADECKGLLIVINLT
jgi:hypothetical protein